MALVDDRGRLFGRFNLVDAVVAVFVVGLIPLLYGAAALFWAPLPVLSAIEPATIARQPGMRIRIKGEHLRPYLRVSFGDTQGVDFLFRSTREAEVNLNDMPPGTYDVILYDSAQERGRLKNALTITPAPIPPTRMTIVGMFGNLDAERAKQLTAGTAIDGVGTIRRVGQPIPAAVRVNANGLLVQIPIERAVMLPAEVEAGCEVQPSPRHAVLHAERNRAATDDGPVRQSRARQAAVSNRSDSRAGGAERDRGGRPLRRAAAGDCRNQAGRHRSRLVFQPVGVRGHGDAPFETSALKST